METVEKKKISDCRGLEGKGTGRIGGNQISGGKAFVYLK